MYLLLVNYIIMERYTISDIKRMVKESIDEITRMGQSVAPATINTPSAKAPSNAKLLGKPMCSNAFFSKPDDNGQEYLTVRLNNIHGVHQNQLMMDWRQKYGQIFNASINQSQRVGNASAPMDLTVLPGQESAFEQIVPNLVQDIANLNGVKGMSYDTNFLNGLQVSIIGRIDEAPSEADLEKAQIRQRANVKDIMMKLSDPEFTKKLGFVGGVSVSSYSNLKDIVKQGNSVGWRLSPMNQLMVLSYLPNASFVTNAWTWDHIFNREVVDPNLFALEVKVANDKPKDINSRMQAAAQLGYIDTQNTSKQPWDVYRSIKKDLDQSQRIAVEFLANILNPHDPHFIKQKVYDISNTVLKKDAGKPDDFGKMGSNGYMYDRFNEEVNFADNIKGIPNAKAQNYLAQSAANTGDTSGQTQVQPQWQPKGEEEIGDIINILSALCSKYCGRTPNTVAGDSLGDTIAHFADFYARYYICPNRQIVKPSLVDAACNAFAIGLASVYNLPVQRRGGQMSKALQDPEFEKTLNDLYQDFMDLVSEINVELLKLSSARRKKKVSQPAAKVVEEDINEQSSFGQPISFDEFKNLFVGNVMEEELDEEPSLDTIQESFFNMLDKLERING